MIPSLSLIAFTFFLVGETVERAKYLRPTGDGLVLEWIMLHQRSDDKRIFIARSKRGKSSLKVEAVYDREMLIEARVGFFEDMQKPLANVGVKDGKAKVLRKDQPAQEFDVPAGVIVTSAPDWTDAWMLCRRYESAKKGKQEFAGLWIHPVEPAQRLTFSIERQGDAVIEHDGKKQKLGRFTIRLRGNSAYAVWADEQGKMIKLVPLPYKDGAQNWIVLEGYEKSTAGLRP